MYSHFQTSTCCGPHWPIIRVCTVA